MQFQKIPPMEGKIEARRYVVVQAKCRLLHCFVISVVDDVIVACHHYQNHHHHHIIICYHFLHGISNYVTETGHVSRVKSVAAIL
jgi:hypothetical protein